MKYFFYDGMTGDCIDSTEPLPISLSEALDVFSDLEFGVDAFLGFVREDGRVLQFAGEHGAQRVLVDIPVPEQGGSLQLRTLHSAGLDLIREFFEGKDLGDRHRFAFHKW